MTDHHTNATLIETRLRVLSWNIWWKFGNWEERQPAIAATLSTLDADVIALQEVWRDDSACQAEILADSLGYHHVFAPSMQMGDSEFGNAILSRWPIVRSDTTWLSGKKETGEGRVALFGEIDGPRGLIPAFCTHLNWKFEHSRIRQQQVGDLARFVARFVKENQSGRFPPVVCGDFNADPMSEEIRMMTGLTTVPVEGLVFHDAWAFANPAKAGMTWSNGNPHAATTLEADRRIDYIMAGFPARRGAGHILNCSVTGNQQVEKIWPSDHFAVLAELRY